MGSILGVPPQPSVRPHDAGADWQPRSQQHVPACVPVDAVLLGKDQWLLHVGPLVRSRCVRCLCDTVTALYVAGGNAYAGSATRAPCTHHALQ
jgi:hypothetical protein